MPKALITYHTFTGKTKTLAEAAAEGAKNEGAEVVLKEIADTTIQDMAACDAILVVTSQPFGTIAGETKKLFERLSKDKEQVNGKFFSAIICHMSDPSITAGTMDRLCSYYKFTRLGEWVTVNAAELEDGKERCCQLGATLVKKMKTWPEQAERTEFFVEGDEEQGEIRQVAEETQYYDLIAEKHQGRWRGEVNPVKTEVADPATLTKMVKDRARELGADLVGITEVDLAFVYKGKYVPHKYAISLGMEMDYSRMATAPSPESSIEVARVYYELGETTLHLAEYIRSLGYDAHSHHPLGGGGVLLVPLAVAAGLGEQGKNGLTISQEFGPRFRSSCVTTDIPLLLDKPIDLGVTEFCQGCQACFRACPGEAIPESQALVRGINKYTTDANRCRNSFNRLNGCAICIKICPFNELAHQNKWLGTREAKD